MKNLNVNDIEKMKTRERIRTERKNDKQRKEEIRGEEERE